MFPHLAQFAKGPAFAQENGHAGQRASRKSDQPEYHRGGDSRFLFYSIQTGERNDGESLRATADPGQLHGGTDHGEDQNQHGVGKRKRAELPAKSVGDQPIAGHDQPPMGKRKNDGIAEIGPGLNGLYATRKSQQDPRQGGAPAVGSKPTLGPPLENGMAVEAEIDQSGDGDDGAHRKSGARGARGLLENTTGPF